MRFIPILMPDISPPLKHATISLSSLYTWNDLLSIVCPFIFLANSLWCFVLMLKLIKWFKMPKTLDYLDGSKQIKILISLLLEHMIFCIRTFQGILSGILAMLYEKFINDTRPLDTCMLLIQIKERSSTCVFCLPWPKVRLTITKIYVCMWIITNVLLLQVLPPMKIWELSMVIFMIPLKRSVMHMVFYRIIKCGFYHFRKLLLVLVLSLDAFLSSSWFTVVLWILTIYGMHQEIIFVIICIIASSMFFMFLNPFKIRSMDYIS